MQDNHRRNKLSKFNLCCLHPPRITFSQRSYKNIIIMTVLFLINDTTNAQKRYYQFRRFSIYETYCYQIRFSVENIFLFSQNSTNLHVHTFFISIAFKKTHHSIDQCACLFFVLSYFQRYTIWNAKDHI